MIMKDPKLAPGIALAISVQMIVSPVAVHAAGAQEILGKVLNGATQVIGGGQPGAPGGQQGLSAFSSASVQALNAQLTPVNQDKVFNPALGQIPGLAEFFARNNKPFACSTLQSTLSEVKSDACKTIDTRGDVGAQMAEAKAFALKYEEINKMYGDNFQVKSNSGGQMFGIGCMADAQKTLQNFFNHRMNELTLLTNEIDKLNQGFIERSKQDIEKIEDAEAVLNGGDLAKKVAERNKNLLDFGKNFDNQACTSMLPKDMFNKLGMSNGLNSINQTLKDEFSKTSDSGKSGESYSAVHAAVVSDINSLAEKVSTQVRLNSKDLAGGNYGNFLSSLSTLGSQFDLSSNLTRDLFSDVQQDFNVKNRKIENDFAELQKGFGQGLQVDFRSDNPKAIETSIANFERSENNSCLARDLNMSEFRRKIINPTASIKTKVNPFIDSIEKVVTADMTFEDKLKKLKELDKENKNRYFVKKSSSYKTNKVVEANGKIGVAEKVVSGSEMETPSLFVSRIIENCQAQFRVNKMSNGMTKSEAFSKLRGLSKSWKALADSQAAGMKKQIVEKLLNCSEKAPTVGTCDSSKFAFNKPGFCASAAMQCSNNMRQCTEQAQKFVDRFTQTKTVHMASYKAQVKKYKADLTRVFQTALVRFQNDGAMIAKAFGPIFNSPSDIAYDLKGKSSLPQFKPELELEDPEEYAKLFRQNIVALKEQVKAQAEEALESVQAHIAETKSNYSKVASKASEYARQCTASYEAFDNAQKAAMAEADKKRSELGEKTLAFCRKYGSVISAEHPAPHCKGNISDLIAGVAAVPGLYEATADLENVCNEYNNESSETSDKLLLANNICMENKEAKFCDELLYCEPKSLESTDSNNKKTVSMASPCSEAKRKSAADLVVKHNVSKKTSVAKSLPAACRAGDTSQPGNSKSDLEKIMESLPGLAGSQVKKF